MSNSIIHQFQQIQSSRKPEDSQAEYLRALRNVLERSRKEILAEHRSGSSGEAAVRGLSDLADSLIGHLYGEIDSARKRNYAILALGGYGRGILNPKSDIDLLFLYDKVDPNDPVTRHVLHTLWDLGFDIGHSTRTIADCIAAGKEDEESLTSMLETRFLVGDVNITKRLERSVNTNLLGRRLRPFVSQKLEKRQPRHARRGPSVQLLEPNVKESPGELRDTHVVGWLLRAIKKKSAPEGLLEEHLLTKAQSQVYTQAIDFLWKTRNELHFATGKTYDVLEHEIQPLVAKGLGYTADGQMLAVEYFMRDYYLHARNIKHLTDLVCERLSGRPSVVLRTVGLIARRALDDGAILTHIGLPRKRRDFFNDDPFRLLGLFLDSQRFGVPLNEATQQAIKSHLHLIDDQFRHSNRASRIFLSNLSAPQGVARTLHTMHELGVLGKYVPEFRSIDSLFQYNRYHIYTADEHTLVAIETLETIGLTEKAGSNGPIRRVLGELQRKDLLNLAILLHDVGKSARDDDHSSTGARMAQAFLKRLGLSPEEIRTVVFLVQNHLLMSHMSQRRDLSEDNLIRDFASLFDDPDTLRMLYLITFADLSSVTRSAWTARKGHLLWELYLKAFNALTQEAAVSVPALTSSSLLEELTSRYALDVIEGHLNSLPARYAELNTAADIGTHLELIDRMEDSEVAISVSPRGLFLEAAICTEDKPYRLSEICGVLATNDINIFSAQAYTCRDGVILDIFQVTTLEGDSEISRSRQKKMESQLDSVFHGSASTEELFVRHEQRWSRRRKPSIKIETEIIFGNDISDEYTVIDIFAQDAVGLLYKITRSLSDLGLDIGIARVSTQGDRAVDSFYVSRKGEKVVDPDLLDQIRQILLEQIG